MQRGTGEMTSKAKTGQLGGSGVLEAAVLLAACKGGGLMPHPPARTAAA